MPMSEDQTQPRGRASLGRALRKGFRAAYDNLGYVVFTSFVAFVATGSLFAGAVKVAGATKPGMGGIVLFLPAALVGWLAAIGAFYYANKSVYHQHPSLGETWAGVGKLFWSAIGLFALDLVVTALLLGDTVFFLSVRGNTMLPMLGVACGYVALVWLMMAMYHLPLLVAQLGMESGPRPLVVVRKSFLLAVDNPGFTVGLFAAIIALAIVCAVPAFIGTAVFCLGAAAFVLTHALRELFVKYGIVQEEPDVVEDKGWPR